MSESAVRAALTSLQDDPEREEAWADLSNALGVVGTGDAATFEGPGGPVPALAEAIEHFQLHGEPRAVADLLRIYALVYREHRTALALKRAHVVSEELFDSASAMTVLRAALANDPENADAKEMLEREEERSERRVELMDRYADEASKATEGSLASSLYAAAADNAFRVSKTASKRSKVGKTALQKAKDFVAKSLETNPTNERALSVLRSISMATKDPEPMVAAYERAASRAETDESRGVFLVQSAYFLERNSGNKDAVVGIYERAIEHPNVRASAMRALSREYGKREQWDDLAALYERALAFPGADERALLVQLAMLHYRMRNDTTAARKYFDRLRALEPNHPGMLDFYKEEGDDSSLLELDTPEAVAEAAAAFRKNPEDRATWKALAAHYRSTGAHPALAELSRARLAHSDSDAEKVAILRELAGLYRSELRNDSARTSTLAQLAELLPHDGEVLGELAEAYRIMGRLRDALATEEKLAALMSDAKEAADEFARIGAEWLERFGNASNAATAYEQVLVRDPTHELALLALREIYTKRRAHRQLFDVLDALSTKSESREEKHALALEMASLAMEWLDDPKRAVSILRRVLEGDGADIQVIDLLEKVGEREKDLALVAEALEYRVKLATDENERAQLLSKLGSLYGDRLSDWPKAVPALQEAVKLAPSNARAKRALRDGLIAIGDYDALEAFYRRSGEWEGLTGVLSQAATETPDKETKANILWRLAGLYESELRSKERSKKTLEELVELDPSYRKATEKLAAMSRESGQWARVIELEEKLIVDETEAAAKVEKLQALAHIAVEQLSDPLAAYGFYERAYREAPGDTQNLALLEEAAERAGVTEKLLDTLLERARAGTDDEQTRIKLRTRAAKLAEDLGRVDDAVEMSASLVKESKFEETAARAYDAMLRRLGRKDELRVLFEERIAHTNTAARISLLKEWAQLEEDAFEDPARAAELYERVLQIVPGHGDALRSLSRIYLTLGNVELAVTSLERDRDGREGLDRANRELEIGRVLLERAGRPHEAFDAVLRAQALAGDSPEVVQLLESMLPQAEIRARVAELLETIYIVQNDHAKRIHVLEVLVMTRSAKEDRVRTLERLAEVHESSGDEAKAVDALARAAREFPAELPFWERFADLATKAKRQNVYIEQATAAVPTHGSSAVPPPTQLAISERLATMLSEDLGDVERALPYYDRLFASNPTDVVLFRKLRQYLSAKGDWRALASLYERSIAVQEDTHSRVSAQLELARLYEEVLSDPSRAIEQYERVLTAEEDNEVAERNLERLYDAAERFDALAALLERRASREPDDLSLRRHLVRVYAERLGRHAALVPHAALILADEPQDRDVLVALNRALELPELRKEVAELLLGAAERRDDAAEQARLLRILGDYVEGEEKANLLGRIASLEEEDLGDLGAAFDAFVDVLAVRPADEIAAEKVRSLGTGLGRIEAAGRALAKAAKDPSAEARGAALWLSAAQCFEQSGAPAAVQEEAYASALAAAPEDTDVTLAAYPALARLRSGEDRAEDLAKTLSGWVLQETDLDVLREQLLALGALEEKLGHTDASIAAYVRCIEVHPSELQALEALEGIYARTGRLAEQAETLRTWKEETVDGPERKRISLRLADLFAGPLGDLPQATSELQEVLAEFGYDRAISEAIAALQLAQGLPDEAAATFLDAAESAEDVAEARSHWRSLAAVRRDAQGDAEGAVEALRHALGLDPSDESAVTMLESLLTNDSVGNEVAGLLRPFYEASSAWEKLLVALEVEARTHDSVDERLALLNRAAEVAEREIGDPARAYAYVAQAAALALPEPGFMVWFERLESLSKAAPAGAYARTLEELVAEAQDDDVRLMLSKTLARFLERDSEAMGADNAAKAAWEAVLEQQGDDEEALVALDALYQRIEAWSELRALLVRRAELADDPAHIREFLLRTADLELVHFQNRPMAIEALERALDYRFDSTVADRLDVLYKEESRSGDRLALAEREIGYESTAAARRIDLLHRLAVLAISTGDPPRAFEVLEELLAAEPAHEGALALLERLMKAGESGAAPARILDAAYAATGTHARRQATLFALIRHSELSEEKRAYALSLARLEENELDAPRDALESYGLALHESGLDAATIADMVRVAERGNAYARLAEILAVELEGVRPDTPESAALAYDVAGYFERSERPDEAIEHYRRAYVFDPASGERALLGLLALTERESRFAEVCEWLQIAADNAESDERRISWLKRLATAQRDGLQSPSDAITTLESILQIDESDAEARASLATAYEAEKRFDDLITFLGRLADAESYPGRVAALQLEVARIEDLAGRPEGALATVERVLELVSAGAEADAALALLERFHTRDDVPQGRVRAALEKQYRVREDGPRLIGVLRERMEHEPSERATIAAELSVLLDAAGDPKAAFYAARDAFLASPQSEYREELERRAEGLDAFHLVAEAYEEALKSEPGDLDTLGALARVHDRRLDAPRDALAVWERYVEAAPEDAVALAEVERLATLLSEWPALVAVLDRLAALAFGAEERASLYRRIGEVRRDMLDDQVGAITSYENALEADPESAWTLDNLIGLLEARDDEDARTRLLTLYPKRVELTPEDEAETRSDLMTRIGLLYEKSGELGSAIESLEEAKRVWPANKMASDRLVPLYRKAERSEDLHRLLEERWESSDFGSEARTQAQLDFAAELLASGADRARARELYMGLLTDKPHPTAVHALQQMAADGNDDRVTILEALEPALRRADLHEELAATLLLRLASTSAGERDGRAEVDALVELAGLYEGFLRDRKKAAGYWLDAMDRGYDARAQVTNLLEQIDEEVRRRYEKVLETRIDTLEGAERAAWQWSLGELYRDWLGDASAAAKVYETIVREDKTRSDALVALENIYAKLGDEVALRRTLAARLELETSSGERAHILFRLASLVFGSEKAAALDYAIRAITERPNYAEARAFVDSFLSEKESRERASTALIEAYRSLGDHEEVAKIHERLVGYAEAVPERTAARLAHAAVLANDLQRLDAASLVLAAGVIEDVAHEGLRSELLRLTERTENYVLAADTLSKAGIEPSIDIPLLMTAAEIYSAKANLPAKAEALLGVVLTENPTHAEALRAMSDLLGGIGRERELIAILKRRIETSEDSREKLARKAASVAEGGLGDARLAEDIFAFVIEREGRALWAYDAQIAYQRMRNADELPLSLERRAELETSEEARQELLFEAAKLLLAQEKNERGLGILEGLARGDRPRPDVVQHLADYYRSHDKPAELARLLALALEKELFDERTVRLELAQLMAQKLDDAQGAISTLEPLFARDASDAAAGDELSALYERTERWDELSELLARRVQEAATSPEKLRFAHALAALLEKQLGDPGRALSAYEQVLDIERDDTDARVQAARLAEGRGEWERAEKHLAYLHASSSGEPPAARSALALRLAAARAATGDREGERYALEEALRAVPADEATRARLLDSYERTAQWDSLVTMLEQDVERAPNDAERITLLRRVARIHQEHRKADGAATEVLERVSALAPSDRDVLSALATAYEASASYTAALGALTRLIGTYGGKRSKELGPVHHRMASILEKSGDDAAALAELDTAFKIDPGNVACLRDLGILALKLGDLERAQRTFRALLLQKLEGASIGKAEVFFHLGEISERQGDKTKAIQMYERAVENDPSLTQAKERLAALRAS
ncbi:MAG: tetratricopeptide repeat protein [Polyangiaceae bacterium]